MWQFNPTSPAIQHGKVGLDFFFDLTANNLGQDICWESTLPLWIISADVTFLKVRQSLIWWFGGKSGQRIAVEQNQDCSWFVPAACIFVTWATVQELAEQIRPNVRYSWHNKDACVFVFTVENILTPCWEHLC